MIETEFPNDELMLLTMATTYLAEVALPACGEKPCISGDMSGTSEALWDLLTSL